MKNKYIVLLILLSSLLSCNDWLDVRPQTEKTEDELFTDFYGFQDALIACYIKLNSTDLYGKNLIVTTTEYLAQFWDLSESDFPDGVALKNFDYENEYAKSNISSIYGAMYNVIIQANAVINNLKEKGDVIEDITARKVFEAEAKAIRAFCHFDILRLFGQLPQNATIQVQLPYSEDVSTMNPPYYSFDDYILKIENDLKDAESLLEDIDPIRSEYYLYLNNIGLSIKQPEYLKYRQFRFNYFGVKALKARFYRYIGESSKAYDEAMSVITAKVNGDNFMDLATISGSSNYFGTPSECIVAFSNNKLYSNLNSLLTPAGTIRGATLYLSLEKLQNDLFGPGYGSNNRYNFMWNRSQRHMMTQDLVGLLKKYQQDREETSYALLTAYYQVVPILRLSEMYLIAMESTNDLTEANKLYATYIDARGIIATSFPTREQLNAEVLNEYRREFYGEGQMFYTYKRLATKYMMWRNKEVTEKDYILPLPSTEYNPNL